MLEALRRQLTLVRGERCELQRRGFEGPELTRLKWDAVKLFGEIERQKRPARPALDAERDSGDARAIPCHWTYPQ